MRGRTNIIARPTPIINGNVENFIAAEDIDVGEFVEVVYTKNVSETLFDIVDNERKSIQIDESRQLFCYRDTSKGVFKLALFQWNGKTFEMVGDALTLISTFGNPHFVKMFETDERIYFCLVGNDNDIDLNLIYAHIVGIKKYDNSFSYFRWNYDVTQLIDTECSTYVRSVIFNNGNIVILNSGDQRSYSVIGGGINNGVRITVHVLKPSITENDGKFTATMNAIHNQITTLNVTDETYFPPIIPPMFVSDEEILYAITGYNNISTGTVSSSVNINFISVKNIDFESGKMSLTVENPLPSFSTGTRKYDNLLCVLNDELGIYCISGRDYSYLMNKKTIVDTFSWKGTAFYNYEKNKCMCVGYDGYGNIGRCIQTSIVTYDEVTKKATSSPVVEIATSLTSTYVNGGLFIDGYNFVFFVQRGYVVCVYKNEELISGQDVLENYVKNFSGNYKAIGFTKTGGKQDEIIQVYVPK